MSKTVQAVVRASTDEELKALLDTVDNETLDMYYGDGSLSQNQGTPAGMNSKVMLDFLFELCTPGAVQDDMEVNARDEMSNSEKANDGIIVKRPVGTLFSEDEARVVIQSGRRLRTIIRSQSHRLPVSIWTCCKSFCFSVLAGDGEKVELLDEVLEISRLADGLHRKVAGSNELVQARRKGVGGSSLSFVAPLRFEREFDRRSSERQRALRDLADFVTDVLPFLWGQRESSTGIKPPEKKLCTQVLCDLLGVSRNFLYKRKASASLQLSAAPAGEMFLSILDTAGVRMRQHRRIGLRTGYPDIEELKIYACGCQPSCLEDAPLLTLNNWWNEFRELATQLRPRQRENQFLLNLMHCPLTNTTVKICDKALSALFTVSVPVIGNIRYVLQSICDDPSLDRREVVAENAKGYKYAAGHPMNRYSPEVRRRVELHLDFVLRADPGASGGVNTCRVYSPEINTQEKLRTVLARQLADDDVLREPLSPSTLQRMIGEYLRAKNCRIAFSQSDHNACPTCKTLQYALLQYNVEKKALNAELLAWNGAQFPRPFTLAHEQRVQKKRLHLEEKTYQEKEALDQMRVHNMRDARIRKLLKDAIDYFRVVENSLREIGAGNYCVGWCTIPNHATIVHQDDMTKVDLPSFVVTASADITRWRFGVTGFVDAVTNMSNVFSIEQGGPSKTGGFIMELILLDHLVRCRGESIKIIISDNASVGKNWITTVALPHYMVDQGLAEVVIQVFLENNHGKYLADMLFGHFQLRRRRSTIVGIDALLSEFESLKRRSGGVQGYAFNPLSSVDFSDILNSLGYETRPPKDINFTKRNIHFAAACTPAAKAHLPPVLQALIGRLLPDQPGMVRIGTEPPSPLPQSELPFEERYIDVPAMKLSETNAEEISSRSIPASVSDAPLSVPLNQAYSSSGPGVVSHRTATHVGYNGIGFRGERSCPELSNPASPVVTEAWPSSYLRRWEQNQEPLADSEVLKCAPENWVLRRPCRRFGSARYPPRNLLNAQYKRGPRCDGDWIPTPTYNEPPFPVEPGTAAYTALKDLQARSLPLDSSINVLDILRCVYERMGDRHDTTDPWFQKRVTPVSTATINEYLDTVRIYNLREKGHPKAPLSLRQAFRGDGDVKKQIEDIKSTSGQHPATDAKIASRLFEQAQLKPGGMDKYERIVSDDMARYAGELKRFRETTQRDFDLQHGFPIERPDIG